GIPRADEVDQLLEPPPLLFGELDRRLNRAPHGETLGGILHAWPLRLPRRDLARRDLALLRLHGLRRPHTHVDDDGIFAGEKRPSILELLTLAGELPFAQDGLLLLHTDVGPRGVAPLDPAACLRRIHAELTKNPLPLLGAEIAQHF